MLEGGWRPPVFVCQVLGDDWHQAKSGMYRELHVVVGGAGREGRVGNEPNLDWTESQFVMCRLVAGFRRVWEVGAHADLDPLTHTGNVRSILGAREQHEHLARTHLGGREGEGGAGTVIYPCGAIHGGWCSMPGVSCQQNWAFPDVDGCDRMAPFLWRIEGAMGSNQPDLHSFIGVLQYALEYAVFEQSPARWLQCYAAFGDLDAPEPHPYRLHRTGMFNQWVLNRNLLLGTHKDKHNDPSGIEVLLIVEDGPTGIELQIDIGGGESIAVSSRRDRGGHWLAVVVAELHSVDHRVCQRSRAPRGAWGDRWSFTFYLSRTCLCASQRAGAALARGTTRTSADVTTSGNTDDLKLASVFRGHGLPEEASRYAALREGGWVAKRYRVGHPRTYLAAPPFDSYYVPLCKQLSEPHTHSPDVFFRKRRRRSNTA